MAPDWWRPTASQRSGDCDAGAWFGPAFAGERVPTLEEALALAAELGLGVNIEIKADRGREYATAARGCRPCEPARRRLPPLLRLELSAGRDRGIARSRAADIAARRAVPLRPGQLGGNRAAARRCRDRGRSSAAAAAARRRNPRRRLSGRGLTVNDPARARLLFAWGVTSVFSDMPDMILPAGAAGDSTRPMPFGRRMPRGRDREHVREAAQSDRVSGREVLPLVEGGKGISVSNGESSGAWAASGGVGTFSGVNADSYNETGEPIPQVYHGRTRRERHEELVAYAIEGGIQQARVAHERSNGQGRIHMNVLWEMAAAERVLHGVLEGARGPDPRRHLRRRHALQDRRDSRVTASIIIRSYRRRAPFAPCGNAPITDSATGSAASSTRTRGWPAAITGCRTARTRNSPSRPIRGCANCAA